MRPRMPPPTTNSPLKEHRKPLEEVWWHQTSSKGTQKTFRGGLVAPNLL